MLEPSYMLSPKKLGGEGVGGARVGNIDTKVLKSVF